MRIVFIGSVDFSRRVLEHLLAIQAQVVGVCTLEKSTFNADHNDLSGVCLDHNIPWIYAPDINSTEIIQWISDRQPDVVFCFGWSKLIGEKLLSLAPLGVVGFHPAALPANRGRHPIIWALALGLKETASTFFFMNKGADSGDILSQEKILIEKQDCAATIYKKITLCAISQIGRFVPLLQSGTYPRIPQDHQKANAWRKRSRIDGLIDWRMSANCIHNLVRALSKPYVGASFLYKGHEYVVLKAEIVSNVPCNIEAGKIIELSEKGPVIKCGEDGIRLLEMLPTFNPTIGEYL